MEDKASSDFLSLCDQRQRPLEPIQSLVDFFMRNDERRLKVYGAVIHRRAAQEDPALQGSGEYFLSKQRIFCLNRVNESPPSQDRLQDVAVCG